MLDKRLLAALAGIFAGIALGCSGDAIVASKGDTGFHFRSDPAETVAPGALHREAKPENLNTCVEAAAVRDGTGTLVGWSTRVRAVVPTETGPVGALKVYRSFQLDPHSGKPMTNIQCVFRSGEGAVYAMKAHYLSGKSRIDALGFPTASLGGGGEDCEWVSEEEFNCVFTDGSYMACLVVYAARPAPAHISVGRFDGPKENDVVISVCYHVLSGFGNPATPYTGPTTDPIGEVHSSYDPGSGQNYWDGDDFTFTSYGGCFGASCTGDPPNSECFDDLRAGATVSAAGVPGGRVPKVASTCAPCPSYQHHLGGVCINYDDPLSLPPTNVDSTISVEGLCHTMTCVASRQQLDSVTKTAIHSWLNGLNTGIPLCAKVKHVAELILAAHHAYVIDGPERLDNGTNSVASSNNWNDTLTVSSDISNRNGRDQNFAPTTSANRLTLFKHEMTHIISQQAYDSAAHYVATTCGW